MDPTTQKTLMYGAAVIVAGFAAYQVYMNMSSETISETASKITGAQPRSSKASAPKKTAYTPKGDPETWSQGDMMQFLESRNMAVGHGSNPSRTELLAMVESKLHEPTSTGFDDPQEWSDEELKEFLRSNKMGVGRDASRVELLAMVESKMHEPK